MQKMLKATCSSWARVRLSTLRIARRTQFYGHCILPGETGTRHYWPDCWIRLGKFLLVLANPVILGSKSHRTHGHISLFHDSGSLSDVGNCCLSLSAQPFLVLSYAGLVTIFYCLPTLGVVQLLDSLWELVRWSTRLVWPGKLLQVPRDSWPYFTVSRLWETTELLLLLWSRSSQLRHSPVNCCCSSPAQSFLV
jgi:hypothetical protein